jgi:hypothetical protein
MNGIDSEKLKILERHAKANSPLMQLFNERWAAANTEDETFMEAANRIQAISQELLNLITTGLL